MVYLTLKGLEGIVNAARGRNIKRSHFYARRGVGGLAGALANKDVRNAYWVFFKLNSRRFWGPFDSQAQADLFADQVFAVFKERQT